MRSLQGEADDHRSGVTEGGSPSLQREAFAICATVVTGPPPAIAEIPDRDTLITTRWRHPVLDGFIPGLPVHTLATYYGVPAPRVWRTGALRLAGTGRPGCIGIVPAEYDGYWDGVEASLSYVFLSDDRLQRFAEQSFGKDRRIELLPRVGEEDPVGSQILRSLGRCTARRDGSARLFVEQALDLLCAHLLQAHSSRMRPSDPMAAKGLLSWQVRRVIAYMRDRLDEDIGLEELASVVGLSRFHFCTAFRLATGRTPYELLISLRIDRARELLGDQRMRVTDIALAVGYKTPSAFASAFHRIVGTTPSNYRRDLGAVRLPAS